MASSGTAERIFARISGAQEEADNLGQQAALAEGRNGLRHIGALSMTKVADGLIDPKLVLAWLLTAMGAPAVYAGALVPIREAGALLPQLPLVSLVNRLRYTKWIWVGGCAGQGVAAGLIALIALTFEDGAAAGLAICATLAVLAVCRAGCSVSYKEILGKTVGKTRRGAVTGLAGSVGSAGVVVFAGLLMSGLVHNKGAVIGALMLAAFLWLAAAALFSTLEEQPEQKETGARAYFRMLKGNRDLWVFILVRGLLVSTALAPPYIVVLAGQTSKDALGRLGALVLASAVASLVSSYVWGRMSDWSSRRVLMLAGVGGAFAMALAVVLWWLNLAGTVWAMPLALFVLMIAYHGVRQGRSTYLVDIAPPSQRAAYAAVTNTVIGLLLVFAGILGGGAALLGPQITLMMFAVMAAAAAFVAIALPEAEGAD